MDIFDEETINAIRNVIKGSEKNVDRLIAYKNRSFISEIVNLDLCDEDKIEFWLQIAMNDTERKNVYAQIESSLIHKKLLLFSFNSMSNVISYMLETHESNDEIIVPHIGNLSLSDNNFYIDYDKFRDSLSKTNDDHIISGFSEIERNYFNELINYITPISINKSTITNLKFQNSIEHAIYPKRLIKILNNNSDFIVIECDDNSINECNSDGGYAIISYSWGKDEWIDINYLWKLLNLQKFQ